MKKTIDTSVVTPEMESAMKVVFVKTIHKMAMAFGQPLPSTEEIDAAWIDSIGGCTEYYKAALEAAPEVKSEPFCYTNKCAAEEFENGLSSRIAGFQDDYWNIPLYLHPPAQSGWLRAIDEALVCHHLDVANVDDSYEVAKDKLNKLLCCVQDIGSYFSKSDLVERIRALEIAEPMGWMDRCHNGVVAKIVELIEGAKCTTQNG